MEDTEIEIERDRDRDRDRDRESTMQIVVDLLVTGLERVNQ
jgi:hypothetical protein